MNTLASSRSKLGRIPVITKLQPLRQRGLPFGNLKGSLLSLDAAVVVAAAEDDDDDDAADAGASGMSGIIDTDSDSNVLSAAKSLFCRFGGLFSSDARSIVLLSA